MGESVVQGQFTNRERTSSQNRALHKYLRQVAIDLNEAGYDVRETIKVPVEFTEHSVKQYMIHPVMMAMFDKDSTADLTVSEMKLLVETMERLLAEKFGVITQFPHREA